MASQSNGRRSSRVRAWGRIIAAFALAPVVILLLVEGVLRAIGYGHSTKPFVRKQSGDEAFYVINKAFYQQFFSMPVDSITNWEEFEFQVPAFKPKDVCRIFVFGSSAANGQPPDPAYAFWRILETMLSAQFPQTRFEWYCAAAPMVNSSVMWAAARACAKLQPDLFIIYMGNNEITGPFGASGKIAQSRLFRIPFIHAHILLSDFRLMQWASGHSWRLLVKPEDLGIFFMKLGPGDPKVVAAHRHFEQNLDQMCQFGAGAGASAIVCSVGSSLRNYGPIISEHRPGLAPAELQAWEALYQAGVEQEAAGGWREALANYAHAADVDDTYADLRFRIGRCYWNLGEYENAAKHYLAAREHDFHQGRANDPINAAVRKVAAERAGQHVFFADAAARLAEHSPHGIPGREFFYDGVHLTFDGNYEVACAVFEQVMRVWPGLKRDSAAATSPLPKSACEERLAFTPWVHYKHLDTVIQMLSHAFIERSTLEWNENIGWWREQQQELKDASGPEGLAQTARAYRTALESNALDRFLYGRYLQALSDLRRQDDLLQEAQTFAFRFRQRRDASRWYGIALEQAGKLDEAATQFNKALALYPDDLVSWFHLGTVRAAQQDADGAIEAFRQAAAFNPLDVTAQTELGRALVHAGDLPNAVAAFRNALKLNPDAGHVRIHLIRALADSGDAAGACEEAKTYTATGTALPPDLDGKLNCTDKTDR